MRPTGADDADGQAAEKGDVTMDDEQLFKVALIAWRHAMKRLIDADNTGTLARVSLQAQQQEPDFPTRAFRAQLDAYSAHGGRLDVLWRRLNG